MQSRIDAQPSAGETGHETVSCKGESPVLVTDACPVALCSVSAAVEHSQNISSGRIWIPHCSSQAQPSREVTSNLSLVPAVLPSLHVVLWNMFLGSCSWVRISPQ